jgi:hypothetical protein
MQDETEFVTVRQAATDRGFYLSAKELQALGRDCAATARDRGLPTTAFPVTGYPWPAEKGYPADLVQEVFSVSPVIWAATAGKA